MLLKKASVKKIKREDEDVRPAGGRETQLYISSVEIWRCLTGLYTVLSSSDCSIYSLSSPFFPGPRLSFLQELADMWRVRGPK